MTDDVIDLAARRERAKPLPPPDAANELLLDLVARMGGVLVRLGAAEVLLVFTQDDVRYRMTVVLEPTDPPTGG